MAAATELMPSRLQLQEEADAAKPRPKANLKATDVKEVYTADSLIGKEIFKHVPTLDWVKDVEANKEVIVTSRFVANRIRSLSGTIEKLKILRYLYILLEFLNSTKAAKGGRQLPRRDEVKTVMAGIPEVLVESVKRRFSDAGFIKKYNVDLIITHCCALACLVDNYEVDMWDLRQDLKLEQREMQQYFMEIGAKIVALPEATRKSLGLDRAVAAQRKVAKLKIPLEFPKMSFAKRR
jgi:DNA-directed RNA polymerase I subunit RPA49